MGITLNSYFLLISPKISTFEERYIFRSLWKNCFLPICSKISTLFWENRFHAHIWENISILEKGGFFRSFKKSCFLPIKLRFVWDYFEIIIFRHISKNINMLRKRTFFRSFWKKVICVHICLKANISKWRPFFWMTLKV